MLRVPSPNLLPRSRLWMRLALLTLLTGALLPSAVLSAPLRIGFHEFAPFSYNDNGQPTGALIELTRVVCNALPEGCELRLVPNPRAKQLLASGEVDALFLGWNEERAQHMLFSLPLLETEYGFYSRPPFAPQALTALAAHKVGVFVPSNTHFELVKLNQSLKTQHGQGFQIVEFPQGNELPLRMLQKGRFHAYFVNRDVGAWYAAKEGIGPLNFLPAVSGVQYCLAFEPKPGQRERVARFNRLIVKLMAQGAFDTTLSQWQMSPTSVSFPADPSWNMPF